MEREARKEREFKARRAEILGQAEKIFAAKGFYNVTMAEIASASGFSIGSLYQYFEGKENLYTSIFTEKLDLMHEQVREKVNSTSGVAEKIETIISVHFQFVENNVDFGRLFIRGENDAPSEILTSLHQKIMDGHFQHLDFIASVLENGKKNGFIRDLPSSEMAEALFGLIRAAAINWLLFPKNKSLYSKKDFILDLFLQGVKKNEK